jgi:hypothetical protein
LVDTYACSRADILKNIQAHQIIHHVPEQGSTRPQLTHIQTNQYNITPVKEKTSRKFERMILDFYECDDNSRNQPGKIDDVKCKGEVKQTRVHTDYLKNL